MSETEGAHSSGSTELPEACRTVIWRGFVDVRNPCDIILNADRDPREGTPFGGDMSHKVTLRSVFVLAVALGIVSVTARMKDVPDVRPQQPPVNPLARPLASFRVY